MKRTTFSLIAVTLLLAGALNAQDVTGTWQGTLQLGPNQLRLVVKVSNDGDKLKAALYSIDQGGQMIPATSASRDGATLKFAITSIGATYEGKLSADGASMVGTFTQGAPVPLTFVKATPKTAWDIPEPPPPPKPMAADANPGFEVATIKPARPDGQFFITINRSGLLSTGNTSLRDLIKFAYDVHLKQITGTSGWSETDKYDITAKPDTPGIPSIKQLKTMVQKLLTERFQLAFHREKKEQPVYAIMLAKTGHKLTPNTSNPNGLPGFGGGARGLRIQNATMSEFASMLQANILEQPVVDQTGLAGARFDGLLRWTPDAANAAAGVAAGGGGTPPAAENPDAPPDLFTAFQQQLGLRLEKTRASADMIVIDKVEKPSAN